MGQLEDLKTFVEIIDQGGIARSAEVTNIAKSAISRRLKMLEERFDVQLVDRRPGQWEVSAAGHELYQRAVQILSEVEALETDFAHTRHSLSGPLSISLPREYGLGFLQPFLLGFTQKYPEIQLFLDFDDRRVDLEHENYDLAIRVAGDENPNHVIQHIGQMQLKICASAQYAATHEMPRVFADLTKHPLLHYGNARRAVWEFGPDGRKEQIIFQPALNSNSGLFLLDAVLKERGIAILPDFLTTQAINSGQLVQILPQLTHQTYNISAAYSKNRQLNRRMRLFLKEISEVTL